MNLGAWTPLQWLALIEHELLFFARVFVLIGSIDELAIDLAWAWLRVTGQARTREFAAPTIAAPLSPARSHC
jgi:adsorption protein B